MRILVCDDEKLIADDIAKMIAEELPGEHTVKCFYGVADIRDYALENPAECFAAAIIDIVLRDGSGIDAAQFLKAKYPDIKLIFVTGFSRYIQNIYLRCENPCTEEPSEKGKKSTRQKNEIHGHGYGLSILSNVAEKYNGSFVTEKKDGYFIATLALML